MQRWVMIGSDYGEGWISGFPTDLRSRPYNIPARRVIGNHIRLTKPIKLIETTHHN